MRWLLALIGILAIGLIAACASISEDACRAGDWRAIGYRDGAAGRDTAYVQRHAEACGKIGIAPDIAAWQAARVEGLALYCTPANAFEVGQRGARLNPVCQGYDPGPLARANARGLRYYDVGQEMNRVQYEIDATNHRVDELLSGEVTPDAKREIRYLRREVERGYWTLRRLEDQRRLYAYPL